VEHQLGHRLLGHLRALGQDADTGPVIVEKLHDVGVGRTHLGVAAFGKASVQHLVPGPERLPQQDRQVLGCVPRGGVRQSA